MIVHTELGSVYELDLQAMTARRVQGAMSVTLRRDEETLHLHGVVEPHVGFPLRMVLDVRGDGVSTIRTTSPVTRIEGDD